MDYLELYEPVAHIELVRTMLAVATAKGWEVHQVDVKGAFLHAKLPESDRIWVKLPTVEGLSSVCGKSLQLQKSLYVLRKAPKLWYENFATAVSRIDLIRSTVTDCIFTRDGDAPCFVIVYVDDLMIIERVVAQVKENFGQLFTVTDLGQCSYFLGIKIDRTETGMFLSQGEYALELVQGSQFAHCKPTSSPLLLAHPLCEERR